MKETFEKIKEKLKKEYNYHWKLWCEKLNNEDWAYKTAYAKAVSIVSEVEAEYGNGKTNADRIRKMSDEELAEYIFGVSEGSAPCVICSMDCDFCEATSEQCKEKTLNWLKSPTND